jgi:mannose-6-phosphate isomerase-like protein (cupin superfamily)
MRRFHEIAGLCASLLSVCACATATPRARTDLRYQRIALSSDPVEQPLLSGPPQTAGMRSGRVVLRPGEHMHRHSTESNEELLLFLKGKARLVLGAESVSMEAGQVLYIPPRTEHEVHNDGSEELRYIYVVAPAGHR